MIRIVTIIFTIGFSQIALAQVATVNLNPLFAPSSPGAINWGYSPLEVGIGYSIMSGDKSFGDTSTGETISTKGVSSKNLQASANSGLEKLALHGHYESSSFEEDDVNFKTETSVMQMMGAYAVSKKLSVGAGYKSTETTNEQTHLASWMDGTESGFDSTTNEYQMGISWRASSLFYLGLGHHYVTQEHSKRVANAWFNRHLGLAILLGDNNNKRWRGELSFLHSPSRKLKAEGGLWINHHREAQEIKFEGEYRHTKWLLNTKVAQRTDKATSSNTSDIKTSTYQLGAGTSMSAFQGGMAAVILGKEKIADSYVTTDQTTITLTSSWSF